MQHEADRTHVRLAELVAALSLGIDLGFGQPMEHVLRQCLIALRLAERLGLDEEQRAAVYYTALLVNVGCHTDAHEQAKWFGDDIALKSSKYDHEPQEPADGGAAGMRKLGAGNPPLHRFRLGLEFVALGSPRGGRHDRAPRRDRADARRAARAVRRRCSTRSAPRTSAGTGEGWPGELEGEEVPLAARIAQLAEFVEVAHRVGGVDAATRARAQAARQAVRPGGGRPACDARRPTSILSGLDDVGTWDAVIDAEPALAVVLSGERFDAALLAIANFVDLKSPYFLGHARAVADLAGRGGARPRARRGASVRTLRRAGLVHDFGRLGISNAIWDKRGPLGAGEWERVRLQPYITERMLRQSEALAPLAAIAVQHRERLDGSGYPRGLIGRRDLAAGAHARRRRRLPGDARAAPASAGALGRRRRGRAARRGAGPGGSTPTPSRPCSAPPATASRGGARGRPG